MKNAVLVQQACGPHEAMLRLTEPIHRAYCARHDIEYVAVYGRTGEDDTRAPNWEKVALLRAVASQGYEYIIWLDADCLIVSETDLREGVPGYGIGATWHSLDWSSSLAYDSFNTGALYIRNGEEVRELLAKWWATSDDGHPWADQHAFTRMFERVWTNTAMGAVTKIPHRWNSTTPNFQAECPVVRAWHGWGSCAEDRLKAMQQAVNEIWPEEGSVASFERANNLMSAKRYAEAEAIFRGLIAEEPGDYELLRCLAGCLSSQSRHEEALPLLRECVAHAPDYGDAWRMLGGTLGCLGEHEASREPLKRALALAPMSPAARWNHALWLLRDGQYEEGFKEYAWGVPFGPRPVRTLEPEWDDPVGRRIFLWCEQGLGDTIMCLRFIKRIRERFNAEQIILEVPPPLVKLVSAQGMADVLFRQTADKHIPYPFDAHASLMSLPRILGVSTASELEAQPYIHAEPETLPEGFKVGVCWRGSKGHPNDAIRSMGPELGAMLTNLGDVTVYPLMQPECGLNDIADTASRIAALDLVITVDTMVAHLAGAMGIPVWILLAKASDYRWGVDSVTTPWYGSARLFRQETQGCWEPVICKVLAELGALRGQTD